MDILNSRKANNNCIRPAYFWYFRWHLSKKLTFLDLCCKFSSKYQAMKSETEHVIIFCSCVQVQRINLSRSNNFQNYKDSILLHHMRLKYIQFVGGWWNVAALTTFCEMTVFQPNFRCAERYSTSAQRGQRFKGA